MKSENSTRTHRKMRLGNGVAATALLLAMAGTAPAMAQDAPAPQAEEQAADPANEDGTDIVVTAQRREERLQDVPVAVSAFDGERLERLNITTSDQLAKITPGLSFTQSSFNPQPQIRGIGTRGLSAGEESTVPVFIDGIYQPYLLNGLFQFNNVERIEVLKGPQSALYGRNATGGAINVITKDPLDGTTADFGIRYARFNEMQVNAYVSGGTDRFGVGVAGVYYRSDGYFHDVVTNTTRGAVENINLRGKIAWRPVDGIRLTLSGAYTDNHDEFSSLGTPINGNTNAQRLNPKPVIPAARYTTAVGHDIPNDVTLRNVALSGDFDLGFASLNVLGSYVRQYQKYRNNNPTATTAPLYNGSIDVSAESFYNEAYLSSSGSGPFDWTVGAVYFTDTTFYPFYSILNVNPATNVGTLTTSHNRIKTKSLAGYFQGKLKLTDTLSIIGGGRFTDETREFFVTDYRAGAVSPRPAPTNRSGRVHYSRFTPSGGIQFEPSRDLNIYAKVGKGFKSGVFSAGGNNVTPADPETITQYEFGIKSSPLPGVRANLSAYYSDYSGLQATARDPVTQTPLLQNAASATIKGVEVELYLRAAPRLNFQIGASYVDGKYDSFPGAQVTIPATTVDPGATVCAYGTGTPIGGNRTPFCDVSGNDIIKTPKITLNVGADYSWDLFDGKMMMTANAQYQSHFFWDTLGRIREPGRVLVDGELTWSTADDRFTVGLFGRNLTNRYYNFSIISSAIVDLSQPARPRSIGIRLGAKL